MKRVRKEQAEMFLSQFADIRQEDGVDPCVGPYSRYFQDNWLVAEVYRDGYENTYFIGEFHDAAHTPRFVRPHGARREWSRAEI